MAITANVTNGKLDKTNTTPTQNRKTSSAKASGSNLGYDDFLKLLSAEMQYQDPLEPTSNTDYVAQMATFSQLEATLSMKESMASSNDQTTKSAALSLVGKEVIVTDKDSASGYYSGKVDYVTYKDGKIQLSINEKMYDYSSLYSVSTDEYYDAIVNSSTFSSLIAKLPKIEDLTIDSKGSIEEARKLYDGLSDYGKQFINASDPPSIIATHLTEVIRSHIAELLTRQDVQNLVNNLKESNPVIVDELIPKLLGLGEIQKVLQNLLSEGISIRDLLTIFETLADHAQTTRDTDVLTEYVRQGLKRAISSKYFPANETTSVITLDPAVEQEIMSSVKQTEQGSYLSLDPDRIKAIIKSVETEIGKLESLGKSAIIITSPIVRMYFKKMTEDYFKDLIVLSYNEVESNVELQSVGMVTA